MVSVSAVVNVKVSMNTVKMLSSMYRVESLTQTHLLVPKMPQLDSERLTSQPNLTHN